MTARTDGPTGIDPTDPAQIAARTERAWNAIVDAGGDPSAVQMVAVTKGFGPDVATAAVLAGHTDLGENYAQELVAKVPALATHDPRWHFIGRVQTNKVRVLSDDVALWQSVDRIKLGREIAKRAPGAQVLVQVNVSDEPQKGGCEPAAVPELVVGLREVGLDVRGLMTVGRTGAARDAVAGFETLTRLADQLDLPERSMGMSGDFVEAVGAGSTMVRLGATLFGARPPG